MTMHGKSRADRTNEVSRPRPSRRQVLKAGLAGAASAAIGVHAPAVLAQTWTAVERVDEEAREREHGRHGLLDASLFEEDVAHGLVGLARARIELERAFGMAHGEQRAGAVRVEVVVDDRGAAAR